MVNILDLAGYIWSVPFPPPLFVLQPVKNIKTILNLKTVCNRGHNLWTLVLGDKFHEDRNKSVLLSLWSSGSLALGRSSVSTC